MSLQTHELKVVGRSVIMRPRRWRAPPAGRRSVGFNAGLACSGRARRQVGRNRVAFAEVHLVRCLSTKRRMPKHRVVFLDVERNESPDRGDAIQ